MHQEPALVPALQDRFQDLHRDLLSRQQFLEDVQDALAGAFAVGGAGDRPLEDFRADAAGVPHFVYPARLHNRREEPFRPAVCFVLGIQAAATGFKLPPLEGEDGVLDTLDRF